MSKRKMVQSNLLKNSISAYFAAIEIHNKPKIAYRYETVTLLIMNAWELALKAYVRKYIKSRSIYTEDGHTISADKALEYVNEHINSKKKNSFTAVKKNIEQIEIYRNNVTHYYCEKLEPFIFMLVARSALNYVDFVKMHFGKDIMESDGLFILPLGFKLPFKPEDFLSHNVAQYTSSKESLEFIQSIVSTISDLQSEGIEDSIVLGFDIYLESVKKVSNSSIIAAITKNEKADAVFSKITHARFTDDPTAQVFNMNDEDFRKIWKYTYEELVKWCKENISGFKQSKKFYEIKKEIETDKNYAFRKRLDNKNAKSPSKVFYTEQALEKIKEKYEA